MRKQTYEVKQGRVWYRCTKAAEQPSGWLHYELIDGTVGLMQPKNWRMAKPQRAYRAIATTRSRVRQEDET